MERQTKHRILGVLVLIGLIVIALPFLQTSNELPSEAALVKTPPFPDQAQESTKAGTSGSLPLTVNTTEPLITPIPEELRQEQASATTIAETSAPAEQAPQPAETLAPAEQAVQSSDTSAASSSATQAVPEEQVANPEAKKISLDDLPSGSVRDTSDKAGSKAAMPSPKSVKPKVAKTTKVVRKKSRTRILDGYQVLDPTELTTTSWAVQVGSFKSKSNAIRLVNVLRTRGYHSFIDQASSTKRGLTKVMVGPEKKKDSAHTLASKLEKEIHVRGVVVHYKPLAL